MTGLDKWKKEKVDKIQAMSVDEVVVEVYKENTHSKYCSCCIHKGKQACISLGCHKGIKTYLENEIEE